jgi:hypothetical protein
MERVQNPVRLEDHLKSDGLAAKSEKLDRITREGTLGQRDRGVSGDTQPVVEDGSSWTNERRARSVASIRRESGVTAVATSVSRS